MDYYTYAPCAAIILVFLLQLKVFVTPDSLERKHREILEDAEKKFATLAMLNSLKDQFNNMKSKIDKIYDHLIK